MFAKSNITCASTNGAPFGALATQNTVDLSTQIIGNLPVANLNSGTAATSSTFGAAMERGRLRLGDRNCYKHKLYRRPYLHWQSDNHSIIYRGRNILRYPVFLRRGNMASSGVLTARLVLGGGAQRRLLPFH